MKRIIDGVTYNTLTATELGRMEWADDNGDHTESLYQTRGGAFFTVHFATAQVWVERHAQMEERERVEFNPLSAEEAQKWMMGTVFEVEVFHNPFEDPPEAVAESELGATIYLRVPASLKQRVDEAAKTAGVSANTWAMRCLERCAAASTPAE